MARARPVRASAMLQIAKFVALLLSILSLYFLLGHAFFIPGSPWQDRLLDALGILGLAAGVCFARSATYPNGVYWVVLKLY